ncbi:dephospho-CoA kinase [Aerococcus sanguinicola]|uniref:dephospho-CoA kinase n=1 Tax=unclassified Aerococcus TaxID=2618060 RepID=UPI0008A18885|nr:MULTISPECIES: dephospho-CoA kinase [unclassified Aerococcus]KAB0645930.1 dephospho-CoA kinase [Aerococcus sanguinicola]MDK6234166.1 dephospho-CoA kinase [Aerococcus sp. UMB10185]MDK6856242.1 dephospho-CoA kinase [Aerococcus sp. UMB7533]MDK8502984.1 dephospho-CoA kinase [Aerococcus sp. UMB1112A]OFN01605.1 dephospho-CoA kinase [Aerococcus sp. HMSC062A02]
MTFHLGLTGSIATGKSSVSKHFQSLGYPIVDADLGSRAVVEPGQPGLEAIREHFGEDYIFPNQTINRKKLGQLIFADDRARQELNQLLQPHIRQWIIQEAQAYDAAGHDLVVLDIPLLYEEGYQADCDQVMVVYCSESVQLERLMARDQLSEGEAFQRICSQISIERKAEWADILIDNGRDLSYTYQQVDAWLGISGFSPNPVAE